MQLCCICKINAIFLALWGKLPQLLRTSRLSNHEYFQRTSECAHAREGGEPVKAEEKAVEGVGASCLVRSSSSSDSELLDFLSQDIEFTIKRMEGNFGWATFIMFPDGMEVGDLDTRKLVSTTITAYDQLHGK